MEDFVPKISQRTVYRLSRYRSCLADLRRGEASFISSDEMSSRVGINAHTIRRDLNYFGYFGLPGTGYHVDGLYRQLRKILRLETRWRLGVVGVGKLGSSLCLYSGFQKQGFDILAAFDREPAKVGSRVNGVTIYPVSSLPSVCSQLDIKILLITVPPDAVDEILEAVRSSNVRGIVNFSPHPVRSNLDPGSQIVEQTIDLTAELEVLTYKLSRSDWAGA